MSCVKIVYLICSGKSDRRNSEYFYKSIENKLHEILVWFSIGKIPTSKAQKSVSCIYANSHFKNRILIFLNKNQTILQIKRIYSKYSNV